MHTDHQRGAAAPGLAAPERAELTPQKDEDLAGANGQVSKGNIKTDTSIVADLDADRKVFATLQARYAIAGFSLFELADGSLFASRCNLCRALPDAHAATRFLRQIGGTA